jgi:hypothetical protein
MPELFKLNTERKYMNRILFLLSFVVLTLSVSAQTTVYPVQTITTVAPPSPVSLEDMYTGAADRIVVQVIVGDASVVNYPVKFKITIAGRGIEISTSPAFNPDPVLINGGETQLFTGSDLSAYFDPANLVFRGYSEAQYRKTGRLPEGAYRLSVEVVDYHRNVIVSKALSAGQMYIFENEPPLLNFPMKDELLSALSPQNILFSWTPRQNPYSSPTFMPEYKFELWEVWPEDKNPNEIVRATEPIYTANVKTSSFLYTVGEPLLFTGRQYVWRIQVIDPENIVQFKQNGYSEIRLFRFGKFCPVPEPEIEKVGPAHIALKWEGDARITKYEVRYREKKSKTREWYTKTTSFLNTDIDNLKANNTYEFQVCAYCDDQPGEYSPILAASTKEETKFQCGATPPNPSLANTSPLDKLSSRDIIHAGDFDVMVASASGSGGSFSGKGWVLVPYLKFIKIEVEFQNISVNDEYRLTAGEIKTIYNIDNAMIGRIGDLSWLYSDKPKAIEDNDFTKVTTHVYRPDSTISSITISSGVVTIKTDDGQEINVRADNKGIVAVAPKDETSTQYVADTKTNTVYSAKPETNKGNANTANAVPQPKPSNTQYKVQFIAHPQEEAGTDYPADKHPSENYETIQLDGKPYLVPWKSMEAAKYDRLVAKISGGSADTVRYRRQSEVMVMTAPMSNAEGEKLGNSNGASGYKQLLLSSLGHMDEDKLYAWYPEYETVNDTTKRQNRILAGQINLASYDKLSLNVYLVPVNGSAVPNDKEVQNVLNAIYKPAVVSWTVNPYNNLEVILKNGKSRILDISDLKNDMEYTTEMDKVKAAIKKTAGYSAKNYYIFFFDGFIPPAGKNPEGYMPFNCNLGFVKTTNAKTIAHELGHGAFRLRHPFSPSCPYPQTEGTTDNLMDYTSDKNATALLKYQWDEVHDRDLGVNLGVDAGEGESGWSPSAIVLDLPFIQNNIVNGNNVLSSADKLAVGAFIPINDDDDNDNGFSDNDISKDPGAIPGENDLYPIIVRGIEKEVGYFTFNISNTNIVIWADNNRSAPVNAPINALTTDQTFYVEGRTLGTTEIELFWSRKNNGTLTPLRDRARINTFQITGPLSVPNYSIYDYDLKIQPSGGTFSCIAGNDPNYAIISTPTSMKIRWGIGPNFGIIQYAANPNFIWQFSINIVEVKIELVPGKTDYIRKGSGAANPTYMRGGGIPIGPSNQRCFMISSGAPTYPPGPNILAGQENIQAAIIAEAKITLNGPSGRGQSQIEVGFIQNISFPRMEVSYVNTPASIHANIESPNFIIDGDGTILPFYSLASVFRGTQLLNSNNITLFDAPSAAAPENHPTNGNNWERFWWQEDFRLWISARSYHRENNPDPIYTNLADADWQFILDLERSSVIAPTNLRSGTRTSSGDFLPNPARNRVVLPATGIFTWKKDGSRPISSSNTNPANNTLRTLTY